MIEYLTEEKLGLFLSEEYKKGQWVRNKQMPGRKFRPDYRNDIERMVVEYDGHFHYTLANQAIADENKTKFVTDAGYKRVAVPYWLQLNSEVIKKFFGIECRDHSGGFPNGFISDTVILPADFCSLGVQRFTNEMKILSREIQMSVLCSLEEKVKAKGDWRLVVPEECFLELEYYYR